MSKNEVLNAVVVEKTDGELMLLPSYRFRSDAVLMCSRLVELEDVKSAKIFEEHQSVSDS